MLNHSPGNPRFYSRSRFKILRGIVLALIVLIFIQPLSKMVWILSGSIFNQIKWQRNGSPNYVIRTKILDIECSNADLCSQKIDVLKMQILQGMELKRDLPSPNPYL